MVTEALKTDSISKLDATPVVIGTSGEGGPGLVRQVNDFLTPTSAKTNGSTYRFVRLPSNAKVKSVTTAGAAMTVAKFDFGVYYSDSLVDGTPKNYNNGTVINSSFFASDYSFASRVDDANITNLKDYVPTQRNKPLWQAVGLSADPGGFLDIVATLRTDLTTGAAMGVHVTYVM